MNKVICLICFAVTAMPFVGHAQQAVEQKIKVGKTEKSGFVATSANPHDKVEGVIAASLIQAGIKTHKSKKHFYTYKGIELSDINTGKIDLSYKVQKKKHRSAIYFIVSRGYDNYVTSATDPVVAANILRYLGKIDAIIASNDAIAAKNEEVQQMNEKLEKEKEDVRKAEENKRKKEQEMEALKK